MRGNDEKQTGMFSYVSTEDRVPRLHPLRAIREMADRTLNELSPRFDKMYAKVGRPSIAPEKLMRVRPVVREHISVREFLGKFRIAAPVPN